MDAAKALVVVERVVAAAAGADVELVAARPSAGGKAGLPSDAAPLSPSETHAALLAVLVRDQALFLEKWGGWVDETALACFASAETDYEIKFHADRVRQRLRAGTAPSAATVRNRRYRAMQQLVRDGEYFSIEAMQARHPTLYDEYVGQYEADADPEDASEEDEEDDDGVARPRPSHRPARPAEKLSELVLRHYDAARLRQQRRDDADAAIEEFDTDDERAASAAAKRQRPDRMAVGRGDPAGPPLAAADLADLRDEYTALMKHRFLAGQEAEFDYAAVDRNEELDDVDQAQADGADRYFDDEEPGAAPRLDENDDA